MMEKAHKILIIEDDQDIGSMIRVVLEYKGYAVDVLKNADRVMEFIKKNRINVVIMDMLLSGANGADICIELKQNASISNIPVIMMSAHPDAETICMKAGADDFVAKPFDLDSLLFKIGHFIATQPVS